MMLLLCSGFFLVQDTWVVDDDGGAGVDFTDLPAAVAAAADGDVLLVGPGSYSHFALTGKGLRIIGAGAATVVDQLGAPGQTTEISDVPAGSQVFLEGLAFPGPADCDETRIHISGTTTRANLTGIVAVGQLNGCSAESSALLVTGAEVLLFGCSLTGGPGYVLSPHSVLSGGCALLARGGARLHVVQTLVTGGAGRTGYGGHPGGGPGVLARSGSRVWIAGSEVHGGYGAAPPAGDVGLGGTGILAESSARVRVSGDPDDRVTGGTGVLDGGRGISEQGGRVRVHGVEVWYGDAEFGLPGAPQTSGFTAAGPLPVLDIDGVFTPTGQVTIEIRNGPPGAPFALWLDGAVSGPRCARDLTIVGEFALHRLTPVRPALSGVLSASGDSSLTVPTTSVGSELHRPFLFQAAALRPNGTLLLSNPMGFALRP